VGITDWIPLPQDRDQWQAIMNTLKNLEAPLENRKFLTS